MTVQLNLFDRRLETEAVVIAINPAGVAENDDRPSLTISQTLFQEETERRHADRGTIDLESVVHVSRSAAGEVFHHINRSDHFRIGQRVTLSIDPDWRSHTARLLCAGRMVELCGPELYHGLRPLGGRYKMHRSRVEFGDNASFPCPIRMQAGLSSLLERLIRSDLPIQVIGNPDKPGYRCVRIGEFPAFPCNGVYPRSLVEVGDVVINRIAVKGGCLQVCYGLAGVNADALPVLQ